MAELHSKGSTRDMSNGTDRYANKMAGAGEKYSDQMHSNSTSLINSETNSPLANGNERVFRDYKEYAEARRNEYSIDRYEGGNEQLEKLRDKHEKYEKKAEKYSHKIERLEEREENYRERHTKTKTTHRLVAETETDEATGREYTHFRVDKVTRKEDEAAPRGLIHKINDKVQIDKVGMVVPVIHKGRGRVTELSEHSRMYRKVEFRQISAPKPVQTAFRVTNKTLLKAENVLLKADDMASNALKIGGAAASPFTRMAKQSITRAAYAAGADNVGVKLAVTGVEGAAGAIKAGSSAVRLVNQNRRLKKEYKLFRYERKADKLASKLDKKMLKGAVAKEQFIATALNDRYFSEGGKKLTRADKKKMWNKVFTASDSSRSLFKKPYLQSADTSGEAWQIAGKSKKPDLFKSSEGTVIDTRTMTRGEIQKAEKINRLEKKQYKQAKKVYQKRTVKEAYVNTATGKVEIHKKKVIDKNLKQRASKPKRPDSLFYMATMGGASMLGRKALNEAYGAASQSDDVATKAVVKGLQFGSNRISDLKQLSKSSVEHKKLRKEKSIKKAEKKMNKLETKLQKTEAKPAHSKKTKKGRQKARQKATNAQKFRDNLRKVRQKAEETVSKALVGAKTKMIVLGGGAIIVLIMIPMMLVPMLGGAGGGGGSGILSGIETLTVYTNDEKGLVDFNNEFNSLVWGWQSQINSLMGGLKSDDTAKWVIITNPCKDAVVFVGGPNAGSGSSGDDPGDEEEEEENNYTVVKHLYGGERVNLTNYDIRLLYAYFTVKYHDDWKSASEEFGSFFGTYYTLESKDSDVVVNQEYDQLIDVHETYTWYENSDGSKGYELTSSEDHIEHIVNKIRYYFLYPKTDSDNPITDYVYQEIKNVGDIDENGISTGEKHLQMLLISLGGHQKISDCILVDGNYYDWSFMGSKFGEYGIIYDVNEGSTEDGVMPDFAYMTITENAYKIEIPVEQFEVIACGKGLITEKSSDAISIDYVDKDTTLTVTYSGTDVSDMTNLSVGESVEDGVHLFYINRIHSPVGDVQPALGLLTHFKIENDDITFEADINPALMILQKDPDKMGE